MIGVWSLHVSEQSATQQPITARDAAASPNTVACQSYFSTIL